MILDLIKLLNPGEIIEIRDNAHEVEVVLWNQSGGRIVKSGQTFKIQELEKIKQNKDAFTKQLIKRLRHKIEIHKVKN